MKKFYAILCIAIASLTQLQAQAPQGFNYQATVRNSSGDLIVNTNVYFKFNVIQGSQTAVPIFTETHYVPTDDLGQVNLVIGQGTANTGTFSELDWSQGSYYLGIELNTGSGYVAMGTTQLLSVPYALYAENSGNSTPGNNVGDLLYWDGENWTQLPSPENNATLKFCDGELTWGSCRPNILIHECMLVGCNSARIFYDLYPNGSIVSSIEIFLSETNNLPDENDLLVLGWPEESTAYTYKLNDEISICEFPIGTYYVRAKVESNLGTSYSETIQVIIDESNQCSNDPVNEQDIITTVEVTLSDGTNSYVLSWEDLDGNGPGSPVTIGAELPPGTYNGDIQLYNKTLDPSDDEYVVTTEILEEDLDHQFFFRASSGLNVTTTYADVDSSGNPIGQTFYLNAYSGYGEFELLMIHEPNKNGAGVPDGDMTNAGGELDIYVSFPIAVEP